MMFHNNTDFTVFVVRFNLSKRDFRNMKKKKEGTLVKLLICSICAASPLMQCPYKGAKCLLEFTQNVLYKIFEKNVDGLAQSRLFLYVTCFSVKMYTS